MAGIVGHWTPYRSFTFAYNDAQIQESDSVKSSDIAAYMKANPSLQIGIDGTMDPNGADPKDQSLNDRRIDAVRTSLVAAGVPASKISVGSYADSQNHRDRRVEVLFSTQMVASSN